MNVLRCPACLSLTQTRRLVVAATSPPLSDVSPDGAGIDGSSTGVNGNVQKGGGPMSAPNSSKAASPAPTPKMLRCRLAPGGEKSPTLSEPGSVLTAREAGIRKLCAPPLLLVALPARGVSAVPALPRADGEQSRSGDALGTRVSVEDLGDNGSIGPNGNRPSRTADPSPGRELGKCCINPSRLVGTFSRTGAVGSRARTLSKRRRCASFNGWSGSSAQARWLMISAQWKVSNSFGSAAS